MTMFFDWERALDWANHRALATGVRHTVRQERSSGLWRVGHR